MESDYSKKIFEEFYSVKDSMLEITLRDGTVLIGKFISFFHGDESDGEPFIIKWHFVDESEIGKPDPHASIDGSEEYDRIIKQEEIKSVKFKK